ncbi:ISL3 family transposase [Anoxybacillus geothermalis]|nr:ISL3 family transposase [Anoxybacillus geothermalis]QOR82997.1 ISL3 family transposase [Geobacillus stearothermophilus]STO11528.1 Transposase and inactivated derivatives [[Flavobacterium] thermophilum]WJQ05775.1 ISL3 family transposase [Geobacillus stearothermophilus]WJQ08739.1 ISL3 family transposase [Geobacillus stearothermophilus]
MYSQFIKELIDLPDVLIQKVRKEGERWIFELSLPEQCPLCPVCLKRTIKMTVKKKQWMHGYAQRIGIFWIELPVERRRCSTCGVTFSTSYPAISPRSVATDAFQRWVAQSCIGTSIQAVARMLKLPYTTVERWFYTHAPSFLSNDVQPKAVCVDEFAFRKGHDYGVAIMDAETGEVYTVEAGKNEEAIGRALAHVSRSVQYVVSDLAPAMKKAIQRVCPEATHVVDYFHVIQLFTDALERCRKYLGKGGKKHGNVRYVCRLLSQCPEKLTEEERQIIREWCNESDYLKSVYQSLQHVRYVFKSKDEQQAKRRLNAWVHRYLFCPCSAVRAIAKSLVKRTDEIISCILSPYSNGKMEGTNNKIKLMKRRGYGYRNIQRFALRVRLETANILS